MRPRLNEKKHFESKANYYASIANGTVFKASIHLEDAVDVIFWKSLFNHIFPDAKFNFIYESESLSGNKTSGCEQCLKYKDYLSNRFFICIDSDYRFLLQEAGISPANFIFQTYTYSIENHLCFATKLNSIPEKCTGISNKVFDFEAFLIAYSHAVYEALIWHLYFLRIDNTNTFSKDEFNKILSLNGMPGFSIDTNGVVIINELTSRCNTKIDQLRATYQTLDLTTEKVHFRTLGLTPDNAYLYVRGHNVFNLIVKIGNEVNNQVLRIEVARWPNEQAVAQLYANATPFHRELERMIVFKGYKEIEKIENDIYTTINS